MSDTCPTPLYINNPPPPPSNIHSKMKIQTTATAAALALLVALATVASVSCSDDKREPWEGGRTGEEGFLLQNMERVVKTDAGEMMVVSGGPNSPRSVVGAAPPPMRIGFIIMEPSSLFIPQYLDSTLVLFIRSGEARVGHIYKDELVEKTLKMGDIYRLEAGSAFYIVNDAEGQRLNIICSIDTSDSMGWNSFQSFFIGGGIYPASILSGFSHLTMSTAFNVSEAELREMLTGQKSGPIVYISNTRSPSLWSKFMDMNHRQKLMQMKRIARVRVDELKEGEEEKPTMWDITNLLLSVIRKLGAENKEKMKITAKAPDACNLYDRTPDFKNNYGWSMALDESDYEPLKHDNFGVYLVNLTAGSMMAPHINPRATEYGIVLRGSGTVQIVYPNGTLAMNARVSEGEVFWIPRYFPFCQIASRTGPFEFFGFTTSARNNMPQFLVGANSLLQTMRGPELAAAFRVSEERLDEIVDAQRESTILPAATVAPPMG